MVGRGARSAGSGRVGQESAWLTASDNGAAKRKVTPREDMAWSRCCCERSSVDVSVALGSLDHRKRTMCPGAKPGIVGKVVDREDLVMTISLEKVDTTARQRGGCHKRACNPLTVRSILRVGFRDPLGESRLKHRRLLPDLPVSAFRDPLGESRLKQERGYVSVCGSVQFRDRSARAPISRSRARQAHAAADAARRIASREPARAVAYDRWRLTWYGKLRSAARSGSDRRCLLRSFSTNHPNDSPSGSGRTRPTWPSVFVRG